VLLLLLRSLSSPRGPHAVGHSAVERVPLFLAPHAAAAALGETTVYLVVPAADPRQRVQTAFDPADPATLPSKEVRVVGASTYVCICADVCMHVPMHVCMCADVCMYVCMPMYVCMCVCVYVCVPMYVWMCLCMCVCVPMYVCTCIR
jgi:hypothetical protein